MSLMQQKYNRQPGPGQLTTSLAQHILLWVWCFPPNIVLHVTTGNAQCPIIGIQSTSLSNSYNCMVVFLWPVFVLKLNGPKQQNCAKNWSWREWETLLINFFSLSCCSFAAHSGILVIATVQVKQFCYSFAEFSLLVLSGSQAFLV